MNTFKTHSSHWGAFSGRYENGWLEVRPHPGDPHPSPLLGNLPAVANSSTHPAAGDQARLARRQAPATRKIAERTIMSRSAGRRRWTLSPRS
jgi:hypothetical protein